MLVAITGMVGSGKTTLATALAASLGFGLVLESVEPRDNPWLGPYFESPQAMKRYCLPLRLHYVIERAEHMARVAASGGDWVADQVLGADFEVFTRASLDAGLLTRDEFLLVERTHQLLVSNLPPPDLVVFLDGPFEVALDRIRHRGRPGEAHAPVEYWREIHERYRSFSRTISPDSLLQLDICEWDFIATPERLESLSARIGRRLGLETSCA